MQTAARSRNKRNTLGIVNRGLDDSISARARAHKSVDKLPISPIGDHRYPRLMITSGGGISAHGALIDKWLRQWRRAVQWVATSWTPKDTRVRVLYRHEICDRDTSGPAAINMKRKPLHTPQRRVILRHHAGGSIDLPAYRLIRSITRAGGEKGSRGDRDRSIDHGRVPTQQDNKSSVTPTGTSLWRCWRIESVSGRRPRVYATRWFTNFLRYSQYFSRYYT